MKNTKVLLFCLGGFVAPAIWADSCGQRIRDKLNENDVFVRHSILGGKFYVNIDGEVTKVVMGDTTFISEETEGYRIEITSSQLEAVRDQSPLSEYLIDLKNRVSPEVWTDSFVLALHLPFLDWEHHPILQDVPKFVRDETIAWINRSQEGYKKLVIEIARDRSLKPEQKIARLKGLAKNWSEKIKLNRYLDFAHEAGVAREALYEKYSEEKLVPRPYDAKLDLRWYVDFLHPLLKEGEPWEQRWLFQAIERSPLAVQAKIIAHFRQNPDEALDFSHVMHEMGPDVGNLVIDTGKALDFYIRAIRMGHDDRKALFAVVADVVRNDPKHLPEMISAINTAPYYTVVNVFRAVAKKTITLHDAQDFILSSYFAQHGYPKVAQAAEIPTFVRALKGEVDADVLAWARIRGPQYSSESPGLGRLFERLADHDQKTVDVQLENNVASILWYPRYPGGGYSWTHTKIAVDGIVYGTMGHIEEFKPIRVHERKGRASLKDAFFKYDIQITQKELENLRFLVKNNLRIAVDDHWGCVQGTCGTFAAATSLKVPHPFNQLPSMTALYLSMRKAFGDQTVTNVQFVGRSKLHSLLSPDLARDISEVLTQPTVVMAGSLAVVLLGGVVYVVHDWDKDDDKTDENAKGSPKTSRVDPIEATSD